MDGAMSGQPSRWPGEPPANLANTSTHELLHPGAEHESQAGPIQQQKRNRNALSCAECRRLKLKCSRSWPCTNCVKRKCAHVCPDDVLKEVRPSRTKEVGALQERIRELEDQLARVLGPGSPGLDHHDTHGDHSGAHAGRRPLYSSQIGQGSTPDVADVAEVMGTLLLGDDGSSRYLGKSAANALFHDTDSDEDDISEGSDEEDFEVTGLNGSGFPMVSRGLELQDFQAMLPPVSHARQLATAYYDNCAYMFEPLKREVFDKHLVAAYNMAAPENLITLEQLACVFMVLALGVLFQLDLEIRDRRSAKYHAIAQACLTSARFLNVPSLASIQCLHLMCTWQLTSHSQTGAFRAWPLLGLAGRMVLSTGLHRDGSIWAIQEPDLSIRRALFWELVCYDRLQGLILGRPYMINSKHFDTIMPRPAFGQPTEGEAIEFHRYKFELSMLIGDLCDDCFSIGRPGYDVILRHDRRLRTFKEDLPAWLQFDSMAPLTDPIPAYHTREMRQLLQRHTITLQIHETLLFLHRVAFAQAIEHHPTEPLRSPWAQSVVSLCLEASRTLIAIARAAYKYYPTLAARWWQIQVHAFGAGVCFAAVCIKAPTSAMTRLAWAELNDAVALLAKTSTTGVHARDLYPRLCKLRDQAQHKLETSLPSPGVPTNGAQHGHAGGMIEDNKSSPRDGSGDGEQLAVLGATTRKLEGPIVGRHQPSKSHAHLGNTSLKHSPSSTHAIISQPLTPTMGPTRPGMPGNGSLPPSAGAPSSGFIREASPMQVYQNIDSGLAQMLADISGTAPGENSAAFPPMEPGYGKVPMMGQSDLPSFGMSGRRMSAHPGSMVNPNPGMPTAPYTITSPGREFFEGHPNEASIMSNFTGAVADPSTSASASGVAGQAEADPYLDVAWAGYFPAPGVGMYDMATNHPATASAGSSVHPSQRRMSGLPPSSSMGRFAVPYTTVGPFSQQQITQNRVAPSDPSGYGMYDDLLSSINGSSRAQQPQQQAQSQRPMGQEQYGQRQ